MAINSLNNTKTVVRILSDCCMPKYRALYFNAFYRLWYDEYVCLLYKMSKSNKNMIYVLIYI